MLHAFHIVADGFSNGNAERLSRNDFTSPLYFICIFTIRIIFAIFPEVRTNFLFKIAKNQRKRTKKKTFINISYPSKVRFRKKVHSQASDHVWFFLNLFSKRPREKKRNVHVSLFRLPDASSSLEMAYRRPSKRSREKKKRPPFPLPLPPITLPSL